MKTLQKLQNLNSTFVHLHGDDWIAKQRIAGRTVADVMDILKGLVRSKSEMTGIEFAKVAEDEILKRGCTPTFKGYKGFPSALCLSVNKQLVHGIPSNNKFEEGDVITFDFGATFEGAIADSATTVIFGEPKDPSHVKMIDCAFQCLYESIKSIKIGQPIGIIGKTINEIADKNGFDVIPQFGGHGITWNRPHAEPFIANKAYKNEGIKVQPGLTIAIEPLLVPKGSGTETVTDPNDKWTVTTNEYSVHSEHSIFCHNDRIEIMTWRTDDSIQRELYFDKRAT